MPAEESASGFVWLVGAGPGDPGLLTLRAVECLRQADLVLFDRLIAPAMLWYAPETARRICVEELAPTHPERYPLANQLLIDSGKRGLKVVRLKGGDPMIFGRAGEEAEVLRQAGIRYEIVPGVTAALGASACAGIPLTHREHASAVAFVTGHEYPGKPGSRLDWDALARFPGTLVFYMGIARLAAIVTQLVASGKSPNTPSAVVERCTTAVQRTVTAPLADLPLAVREANLAAPALLLIGDVVSLRQQIHWYEQRPLFGKTILVTRPAHQAEETIRRIESLGGRTILMPTVTIQEPQEWAAVDDAIERLSSTGWLVFTSANGVHAFLKRLRKRGHDLRALGATRIAVIGPATAEALRGYHLEADVIPATYNSEGLVEALRDRVRGHRVLLARADRGLDLLREELSLIAEVEQVAVYSQRDATLGDWQEGIQALSEDGVDFVTLSSSSIARVFLDALDESMQKRIQAGRPALICISPRTAEVVRGRGLPVAAEAGEYTTEGILTVVCELSRKGN